MKKRVDSWIFITKIFIFYLVLITGCKEEEKRIPELTTLDVSEILTNSASSGGNITSDGGSLITSCGVCWSINTLPTIKNNKTTNGNSIGTFKSSINALTPNTKYYVRAFATNEIGTAYGNEVSFMTNPLTLPTLTTKSLNTITSTSAKSGGVIVYDGGSDITSRGVCWSTSQNPVISDNHSSDGLGTVSFVSSITGLSLNNTYYVRAYATNSIGTAYGNEISFKPEPAIGESFQGGKVAYLFKPSDSGYISGEIHGIIAAPFDQSTSIVWEVTVNHNHHINTSTSIGSGQTNTNLIISILDEDLYAAKLCNDLVLSGYDDWFLPSKDELNLLYINRLLIGDFSLESYWSSSSSTYYFYCVASSQNFNNGNQLDNSDKSNRFHVRAIRYF